MQLLDELFGLAGSFRARLKNVYRPFQELALAHLAQDSPRSGKTLV